MLTAIRHKLRKSRLIYDSLRSTIMLFKRLRFGLRNVHPTFYMSGTSAIAPDFKAGPYSFISFDCLIGPGVSLGAYSMFGPRVAVVGGDHRLDLPGTPMIFSGRPKLTPTIIEDDVWVGYGSVIMAGVRIGRGSIVAAGSIVTKDIPPYEIHGGVPARKLRNRFALDSDQDIHDKMLAKPPARGVYPEPLVLQPPSAQHQGLPPS